MPILVKNGRVYTSTNSGSGTNAVEMTQAQYDALQSPDPDIIYFITDGTAGYPSADDIEYDNTTSGLTATNTQAAIDEITKIVTGTLTANSGVSISEANIFKVGKICTVTCTITVSEAKSGYTRLVEIPQGFRPYRQIFRGMDYDVIWSGAIRNRNALSSGASLYVSETYIIGS